MDPIQSIEEDDVQTLVKLGLNVTQAKIYLTLVAIGTANAKKISQTAKVDNAEVYRQLESLQEKGLLERTIKFPYEYTSIPLNETLELLLKQKNMENLELQEKAKKLMQKNSKIVICEQDDFRFSIIPTSRYTDDFLTRKHLELKNESLWYTQITNLPSGIEKTMHFGIKTPIKELNFE